MQLSQDLTAVKIEMVGQPMSLWMVYPAAETASAKKHLEPSYTGEELH